MSLYIQNRKENWADKLKSTLSSINLNPDIAGNVLSSHKYGMLRYMNQNYIAAVFYASGDISKFPEALGKIEQPATVENKIILSDYTKIFFDTQNNIYIGRNAFKNLLSYTKDVDILRILLNSQTNDYSRVYMQESLNFEEILKYSTISPQINISTTGYLSIRLAKLVDMGWYMPNIKTKDIYMFSEQRKREISFVSKVKPVNFEINPINYVNYMKWSIYASSDWNIFQSIYDTLISDSILLDGLLKVANLPTTLEEFGVKSIELDDLTHIYSRKVQPEEKKEYRSIDGSDDNIFRIVNISPTPVDSPELRAEGAIDFISSEEHNPGESVISLGNQLFFLEENGIINFGDNSMELCMSNGIEIVGKAVVSSNVKFYSFSS